VAAHHKLAATERLMSSKIGEPDQWKRYDSEFHRQLISNCGSQTLMEAHAAVFDKYFRYQMIALNYRGDEPARQHQALLACALARDAVRAKSVLVDHVTGCVAHALATGTLR
jgi:DNA-binding GntR family transcriptional regulator